MGVDSPVYDPRHNVPLMTTLVCQSASLIGTYMSRRRTYICRWVTNELGNFLRYADRNLSNVTVGQWEAIIPAECVPTRENLIDKADAEVLL